MCFMMVAITGDGAKHRYVAKQSKDEYEPDDTYKRDIEPPVLPRCVGIRLLLQGSQYPSAPPLPPTPPGGLDGSCPLGLWKS